MVFSPNPVQQRESEFQQINRLTNSHSLRGSESLCKLLRYLAEQSVHHPGATLKEYQIAVEVLGRSGKFDPHNDSAVRVQVGRLRLKLDEYYASEGVDDPLIVDLPKGSYALSFHPRPLPSLVQVAAKPPAKSESNFKSESRGWFITVVVLSVILAGSLLTTAWLATRSRDRAGTKEAIPRSLQLFWGAFMADQHQPRLIFSNASFVGRPQTGMRYFKPSSDPIAAIFDYYTGVGEVLAVHELDQISMLFGRQIQAKRGALFTLDDAKNNNLIFVGSPAENLSLLDIPGTVEFVFQWLASGPQKGYVGVWNVHPGPGEPAMFFANSPAGTVSEDYAVVGLLPGLDSGHSMLVLAGTTTMGTQAAAEYVCREDSVAELLQRLGVSRQDQLKPFEALLRVKVSRGVPVKAELVAIRSR